MKRIPSLTLLLLLALTLTSCLQHRYVMAASKPNAPILHKKNDGRLNGSFSFGKARNRSDSGDRTRNYGFDLQGSFAPTARLGLIASYYTRRERDRFTTYSNRYLSSPFRWSQVDYQRRMVELGAGYLVRTERFRNIGLFAGFAFGNLAIADQGLLDSMNRMSYNRFYEADVRKVFLHPSFTILDDPAMAFNFALRLSWTYFRNERTDYLTDERLHLSIHDLAANSMFAAEPAFTLSFSLPCTRFLRGEVTASALFDASELRHVRNANLSIGLTAHIGELQKPQPRKRTQHVPVR